MAAKRIDGEFDGGMFKVCWGLEEAIGLAGYAAVPGTINI